VDMTPDMLAKARRNIPASGLSNVEFRLGEIEHLPVADNSVDVVISNCVINLVPNKKMVFREAFRVLNAGGRLAVSDVVLRKELPDFVKQSTKAYIGCLAGAIIKEDYLKIIESVGFKDVQVVEETAFPIESLLCDTSGPATIEMPKISAEDIKEAEDSVSSIKVSATKPI